MEDAIFAVIVVVAVVVMLFIGEKKREWGENPRDAKWGKR